MKTSFSLNGADAVDALLKQLPGAAAKRVGRAGTLAGGRVIANEAKRRAPKETGDLKKAIKAINTKDRGNHIITAQIGIFNRQSSLGHLIEFGTSPHEIKAKKKKVLKTAKGRFLGKTVDHPGAAPKPFLRGAADSSASAAFAKMAEIIGPRLEAEALKIVNGAPKRDRGGRTYNKEAYIAAKIAASQSR